VLSLEKINTIIEALRYERYRWTPARRIYIPKKNGKLRPLSMPSWSDKLLQEVIRSILEAYYELQFSQHSHGFRLNRGCHTALKEITQKWKATKWFIEGDISACFDSIDHNILLNILQQKFHDKRFLRLLNAYSIVCQYQAEYRGIVQYYRMAYNLHMLGKLKRVMELSLVKTLAKKFKTTCQKIYKQYHSTIDTKDGIYKVLLVKVEREEKSPLITYFGGIPLRWNKWVTVDDTQDSKIWNGRSEVVERLLAQKCEICGAMDNIEVHHIRKLADIKQKGCEERPEWMNKMSARKRKTLVVCRPCHEKIQYGRYNGATLKT